ncbi:hypothetical protein [Chryseobacterium sp.]|uniref:hypothetical protein n=1 Tax=Chryseobacterium sp. TaxID=1871047 RepID=UPI0028998D58|nr:hypothetical protein [Chryseobacterium sp.]
MKIIIPKPCHENWENMTEDERGKFCSVCSKTVHDFTASSDEELINSLGSGQNICGRFREDQLGRNLNLSLTGKLAMGLLIAGGALGTVNAQEAKPQEIKTTELPRITGKVAVDQTVYRSESFRIGASVSKPPERAMVVLNGKRVSEDKLKALKSEDIKTINTLSPKDAMRQYGKAGKNGAIIVTTKKKR